MPVTSAGADGLRACLTAQRASAEPGGRCAGPELPSWVPSRGHLTECLRLAPLLFRRGGEEALAPVLPPAGALAMQELRQRGLARGQVQERAGAHEVHAQEGRGLRAWGRVRGGEEEALGPLRPHVQPPPREVLVREDGVQALGSLGLGPKREDHLHVPQAHDEVHDFVQPACRGVLVASGPSAALATCLWRVLPAERLPHPGQHGGRVEPAEGGLGRNLQEAQEPLGRGAESDGSRCGDHVAQQPLADPEALGIHVGLQGLAGLFHRCCTATRDPMLHHQDLCGKVEDKLVAHRLTGSLLLSHLLKN
mmetsp:Transcript_28120/g.87595  ORF Transcript_28120/g.87595 Transcript_28120/m.87595 type:complete len:308 (-) Transcript_28120:815-1738(-)